MDLQSMAALKNLVRVGSVQSVSSETCSARVAFPDKQDTEEGKPLISAPLKVLQMAPLSGKTAAVHWLPSVGQWVVCLYIPNGESDGFVIGGL